MAYLMLRFTRRHRGPVFAGAGLLLALVLGAVGTSIGMKRALDAKEELVGKNAELDRQKLALVDYKERLAGLLESNQKMLGEVSKMNMNAARLPEDFEALRKENQALSGQGRQRGGEIRSATPRKIKRLQQAKAKLEELAGKQGKEK